METLPACIYVPGAQRGQRRALDSLELGFGMVVSCSVDARNPIQDYKVKLLSQKDKQHKHITDFSKCILKTSV